MLFLKSKEKLISNLFSKEFHSTITRVTRFLRSVLTSVIYVPPMHFLDSYRMIFLLSFSFSHIRSSRLPWVLEKTAFCEENKVVAVVVKFFYFFLSEDLIDIKEERKISRTLYRLFGRKQLCIRAGVLTQYESEM